MSAGLEELWNTGTLVGLGEGWEGQPEGPVSLPRSWELRSTFREPSVCQSSPAVGLPPSLQDARTRH